MPAAQVHKITLAALLIASIGVAPLLVDSAIPYALAQSSSHPLLQKSDLTYLGSFRLKTGDSYFSYGGNATSFYRDPTTGKDTLYARGHDHKQTIGQVEIPSTLADANTVSYSTLPLAPTLQIPVDATEGALKTIDSGTVKVGGTLPHNEKLIITGYSFYDADGSQELSHGVSHNLDLSKTGDFSGFAPMSGEGNARTKAGYMAHIPPEWQAAFGGAALTGNCCLSIISSTSSGPAAHVFDPAQVGSHSPIPATTLVYYPLSHPLQPGGCDKQSEYFNCTTSISGIALPEGSSSVLFFGRQGIGEFCYGTGGTSGDCYDPESSSKGNHAYPYRPQVWAYDANDLLAVKSGQKKSWEIRPYALFDMSDLMPGSRTNISGAGYDPLTQHLYLTTGGGTSPRVDVFSVATDSSNEEDTVAPSVLLTTPENNAAVSGTVTLAASASDNIGVAGVQFKEDNNNLGNEDTTSPYSLSWDTTTTTDGAHTLSATARDAAGNTTTSSSLTVTVNNSDSAPSPSPAAAILEIVSPLANAFVTLGDALNTHFKVTHEAGDAPICADITIDGVPITVDGIDLTSCE